MTLATDPRFVSAVQQAHRRLQQAHYPLAQQVSYAPETLFSACTAEADRSRTEEITDAISSLRYQVWGLLWDFKQQELRWQPGMESQTPLLTGALAVALALRALALPASPACLLPWDKLADSYTTAARTLKPLFPASDGSTVVRRLTIIAAVFRLAHGFEHAALLAGEVAQAAYGQRLYWRAANTFHDWKRRVLYCYDALETRTPEFPFFDDMNAGLLFRQGHHCQMLARHAAPHCAEAQAFLAVMQDIEATLGELTLLLYVRAAA